MNSNVQCYFGAYNSWVLQISEGNKCRNNTELEMLSIWFQFDLKFSLLTALEVIKITTSNEEKFCQNDISVSVMKLMHKLLLPQHICYLIPYKTTWRVLQMTIKKQSSYIRTWKSISKSSDINFFWSVGPFVHTTPNDYVGTVMEDLMAWVG